VEFRSAIRVQANPRRRFRLAHAVSQNISLRGMQILSPAILERKRPFEIWIPLKGTDVVPATAKVEWMALEDSLGDSPYWVRSGVSLTFRTPEERRRFADAVLARAQVDRVRVEQETSKVGFVF
jgi:hypothetical protein